MFEVGYSAETEFLFIVTVTLTLYLLTYITIFLPNYVAGG